MDEECSHYDCRGKGRVSLTEFLPFHKPFIGEEEKQEILDTLETGWLTKGPKTKAFEKQFAEFLNIPFAVATNSCTSALHLALVALKIAPGDEVITTPVTFAATINVIEQCGAKPVFVDVEEDTLNINVDLIEKKITPKTKCIIPVHLAGKMCKMDKIMEIAQKHNLKVIEDAAHSIESDYKGVKPGQLSDAATFSFYPTKNITTGEGGMLVTKSADLADRVERLALHGLDKDAWKRYSKEGYKHWEILEPGFKYHMCDIQASLGIHQLKRISNFWKTRKELTEFYNYAFLNMPEISPVKAYEDGKDAHHLYIVRLNPNALKVSRDEFLNLMHKEGIGCGIHFYAIHLHYYYREKYKLTGTLPVAEKASSEILSLPLYPLMTKEDASDVVRAVKKIVNLYRK